MRRAGVWVGAQVDPLINVSIHIYRYRSKSSQVASKMLLNMANARQGKLRGAMLSITPNTLGVPFGY